MEKQVSRALDALNKTASLIRRRRSGFSLSQMPETAIPAGN
jgi:hypothetical protein